MQHHDFKCNRGLCFSLWMRSNPKEDGAIPVNAYINKQLYLHWPSRHVSETCSRYARSNHSAILAPSPLCFLADCHPRHLWILTHSLFLSLSVHLPFFLCAHVFLCLYPFFLWSHFDDLSFQTERRERVCVCTCAWLDARPCESELVDGPEWQNHIDNNLLPAITASLGTDHINMGQQHHVISVN